MRRWLAASSGVLQRARVPTELSRPFSTGSRPDIRALIENAKKRKGTEQAKRTSRIGRPQNRTSVQDLVHQALLRKGQEMQQRQQDVAKKQQKKTKNRGAVDKSQSALARKIARSRKLTEKEKLLEFLNQEGATHADWNYMMNHFRSSGRGAEMRELFETLKSRDLGSAVKLPAYLQVMQYHSQRAEADATLEVWAEAVEDEDLKVGSSFHCQVLMAMHRAGDERLMEFAGNIEQHSNETFSILVMAACAADKTDAVEALLEQAEEADLEVSVAVLHKLIGQCAADHDPESMWQFMQVIIALDLTPGQDLFQDMYRGFARLEQPEDHMLRLLQLTRSFGYTPTRELYNWSLDAADDSSMVENILTDMKTTDTAPDQKTMNKTLHSLSKFIDNEPNKEGVVEDYFGKMSERDVKSYTIMIHFAGKQGRLEDMTAYLDEMKERGFVPDEVVFSSMIHAYAKAGKEQAMLDTLAEMTEQNLRPTKYTYTALLRFYAHRGQVKEMMAIYEEARNMTSKQLGRTGQDTGIHVAVIFGAMRASQLDIGAKVYDSMVQSSSPAPDLATVDAILRLCKKTQMVDLAVQVVNDLENLGVEPDTKLYEAFGVLLASNGYTQDATKFMQLLYPPYSTAGVMHFLDSVRGLEDADLQGDVEETLQAFRGIRTKDLPNEHIERWQSLLEKLA